MSFARLACVVCVFLSGFAYVLRCCLRFCFLPFALGLCASVRERVRALLFTVLFLALCFGSVCECACVLTWLLVSMLHAPPSNTTFLLACVNVWCVFAWCQ